METTLLPSARTAPKTKHARGAAPRPAPREARRRTAPGKAAALTPEHIVRIGASFMASKTLLSAVELGVFTALAPGPLDLTALTRRLGLHPRSARDFLDALVGLGFLERQGELYSDTPETAHFLDRAKPTYIGGLLEMANARLYGHWGSLTQGLKTGKPQNEAKRGGDPFAAMYRTPEAMRGFLQAMTGISLPAAQAIARQFPWRQFSTFADIGTAQGAVPAQLALAHPHLRGLGFDLPAVQPVFEDYVRGLGVDKRVAFRPGNFFQDALPNVDVLIMGHILHDWDLDQKRLLLRKAYEALPPGGSLIVYEAIIDDQRRENVFGLIMSLNMLIETPGGFDFTGADCQRWMREAGFRSTRVEHLAGPDSMVIGIK